MAAPTTAGARSARRSRQTLPAALDRRFEAVVFDWDGTAVPDRSTDAEELRALVEQACGLGLHLGVVTGTHIGNVDGQLQARPAGPGRLYLCVNRGSEVFVADEAGLHLLERREAAPAENAALDAAAASAQRRLEASGLRVEIVSDRLNRRKIDLIPEPEWRDPPKTRIGELLAAVEERLRTAGLTGLMDAVELAEEAAREAGLPHPRVTSDAKHVEIGLTDKSDAARRLMRELAELGVAPGLVLIVGDEFGPLGGLPGSDSLLLVDEATRATAVSVGAEPTGVPTGVVALGGGPQRFLAVLADQVERRQRGDVPDVDRDPAWTVTVTGVDPLLERVHESQLTIANSLIGTRGTPLLANPACDRRVLAAGVYTANGDATELVSCPDWSLLPGLLPRRPQLRRTLDLRTGLLRHDGPVPAVQFCSLARPQTAVLRASRTEQRQLPESTRREREAPGIHASIADRRRGPVLERVGAYARTATSARDALAGAEDLGFERLLAEHREAWARRWRNADIVIEGDAELQHAVRFALFHLMASVADEGEAAVGARGLSGTAYRGHVFWDSDVFVLPFLAATHPAAARAMLEYRLRRLPAAREAARRTGFAGARFPWESAATGFDVTPSHARLSSGEIVPIRTGELEAHIVADVPWAASCYADWTGDVAFIQGPGRDLFLDTARYWASRVRFDEQRRAHIAGVIGPDEYHGPVDDNAFTNVLARWNLRRAAELAEGSGESDRWMRIADALVDGFDPSTGIYEQFAGFFGLEPLVIEEIAPRRPIAAELLLGAERTAGAQVLKQADVLMLHHMLPGEVAPGSLLPNLDFYEPRTAHGSSLSPAIHAALLARAGRYAAALDYLRIAARLDLDDLTGTTAAGLHLATMGGLWQAIAFGFAGIRPRGGTLVVDPRLPPEWDALELALIFRGRPLRLRLVPGDVTTCSDGWTVAHLSEHWEVIPT